MKEKFKKFREEYLKIDTYNLVTMAMLVALEIVFSRFLSIQAYNIRIGFSFMALALAGMLLGPVRAGLVGCVADVLGLFLFSGYTFNPGITLTTTCVGVLFGICLYKNPTRRCSIIAVLIHQIILSLGFNSLWLALMYGMTFFDMAATRLVQTAIMIPVELATVILICNKHTVHILSLNKIK